MITFAVEATMEVVRLEETNDKTTNNAALSYVRYPSGYIFNFCDTYDHLQM